LGNLRAAIKIIDNQLKNW